MKLIILLILASGLSGCTTLVLGQNCYDLDGHKIADYCKSEKIKNL